MLPEQRDRVIAAGDESARQMGVGSLDQAIDLVYQIGERLKPFMEQMRTREKLIATLDQMEDIPPEEEPLALALFANFPKLLGVELRQQLPEALKSLPGLDKGRKRSLTNREQAQLCDFVSDLYNRGVTMRDCKKRAAQRFNVGVRTVERTWSNRRNVTNERSEEPDFQEVLAWARKLLSE